MHTCPIVFTPVSILNAAYSFSTALSSSRERRSTMVAFGTELL